jgi:ADP-heptose:LPS heptosyltransferase
MADKTKNTGRFKRLLFRLLGPALSQWVVMQLLRKKIDWSPAALPADLSRSAEILVILPADRLDMIFQMENLYAVIGRYKDSNLTFVCPAAHVSFVNSLKNARLMKYNPAEFQLYSAEFKRLVAELAVKSFDICVMLEQRHTLAHLYLAGLSRAHLRVGWDVAAGSSYPFLNIRLVAAKADASVWERNLAAARILEADVESRPRWGVQKSAAEEVAKVLSEKKLKKDPALVCIDLFSMEAVCGKEWCAELMKALKSAYGAGQFCVFGGMDEDNAVIKDAQFPVLPPMSIPKTAALIAYTDLVIAGFGPMFGLTQISTKSKVIPVLSKGDADKYCKKNERVAPVVFADKPGAEDIKAVVRNVRDLLKKV